MVKREDDFQARRAHLASLSDEELKARFWALTEQLVDPLLRLGKENTTPAIERSVLLRMGFSSLEAKQLVSGCIEHGLLGYGAGNVVYRLSLADGTDVRTAGLHLLETDAWARAASLFMGGATA